jgi:small-conductance mechanosensitive channel
MEHMDIELTVTDALIYLATGIIAAILIHFVFRFLKKRAELTETKLDDLIVHSLSAPLVMLAFFIPFFLAIRTLIQVYPGYAWLAESNLLVSGYILVGTWTVATFVDDFLNIYGVELAKKTETDLDDRIIDILKKIAKYIIWFIGFMYILTLFSINITPLIAGAGIVGIAIALAAQDLFSNFFGGAVIITDQPFRVGDRVLINDVLGDVINIGPRSTRIITLDSDIVTIPNSKIASSVVHNYSLPNPQIRIQITVTVSSTVDIKRIKGILSEITDEAVKDRPDILASSPRPTIHLMKTGGSAMAFVLTVFANGFVYNDVIQDYLNTWVVERFRKEGISLL